MTHNRRVRIHGFDNAGHMASTDARYLLELARAAQTTDSDEAFIVGMATNDDLAEQLAEAAVTRMTTGEDEWTAALDADVTEELGGPFVETSGMTEFADGTDESNVPDASREPFPQANGTGNRT